MAAVVKCDRAGLRCGLASASVSVSLQGWEHGVLAGEGGNSSAEHHDEVGAEFGISAPLSERKPASPMSIRREATPQAIPNMTMYEQQLVGSGFSEDCSAKMSARKEAAFGLQYLEIRLRENQQISSHRMKRQILQVSRDGGGVFSSALERRGPLSDE